MYQLGNTLRNFEHQKLPLALPMKNAWSSNECELYIVLVCKIGEMKTTFLTFDVGLHISSRSSGELWKKIICCRQTSKEIILFYLRNKIRFFKTRSLNLKFVSLLISTDNVIYHSFSILSDDRSKASSNTMPSHSAI